MIALVQSPIRASILPSEPHPSTLDGKVGGMQQSRNLVDIHDRICSFPPYLAVAQSLASTQRQLTLHVQVAVAGLHYTRRRRR